jgi:hypothetical protein
VVRRRDPCGHSIDEQLCIGLQLLQLFVAMIDVANNARSADGESGHPGMDCGRVDRIDDMHDVNASPRRPAKPCGVIDDALGVERVVDHCDDSPPLHHAASGVLASAAE